MIAKELRAARWVTLAGLVLVAFAVIQLITINFHTLTLALVRSEADGPIPAADRGQISLGGALIWAMLFANALWLIAGFGGVIVGSGLIASEAGSGSILLLLSRPVSRTRALLTKYAVGVGLLLVLACLCGAFALLVGGLNGVAQPPLGGLIASVLLLWLASLFVMGVTLVWSVLVPSALAAGIIGFLTCYAIVIGPAIYNRAVYNIGGSDWSLASYWGSLDIYAGVASAAQSLAISLAAALIPPLLALALFRRKAF
jgi:ABC-type transport system involved in multi-copper enzyme maturation permease subunit